MEFNNSSFQKEAQKLIGQKDIFGKVRWQSPSNIALIKYWGKRDPQLPMNPSLSFSLKESYTDTSIHYQNSKTGKLNFDFFLEGKHKPAFEPKLNQFFQRILPIFPFLDQLELRIDSKNTFPHSAGIASSASAMSAMALALVEMEQQLFQLHTSIEEQREKASFIARLGSGSAARSVYGGFTNWGKNNDAADSSDFIATKVENIHPAFTNLHDHILLLNKGEKSVSSTAGHALMNNHPFAKQRFKQANEQHEKLKESLSSGNFESFIEIVESEALSLHAMMMTSNPGFILMKPQSILGIEKIRNFRIKKDIPVCFTLDAGPNIHLIFPDSFKSEVNNFIETELMDLVPQLEIIEDRIGKGPKKMQ